MHRGRISYGVGNKHNPGDPFGRSNLTIELDGKARLDQDTLGGVFSFTGTVVPAAMEKFWKALDESGFPAVTPQPMPAGSASRALSIGEVRNAFPIPYHATARLPGYGVAFSVLDTIVRQISLDTVKAGPQAEPIVEGVVKLT